MQKAAIPEDEQQRLDLLKACNIIYTPAEEAFDDVARLAAELCDTEIALITLVDADYQWFKARVGVQQTGTARDLSFCGHCIHHKHPLLVEDTLLDPRFADNPLVTGDPNIRFYAGVPLVIDEGSSIGALSVASRRPRSLTERQLASLERLARQISRELSLRRNLELSLSSASGDFSVAPGTVVGGRWHIVRELGRGATGAVFEASEPGRDRVAIKVLLPAWRGNEEIVERFAREARILMRLKTPHVGKLLDVGNLDSSHGALPFLALEYLEGTDLDVIIRSQGRVPYREALSWCADASDGLAEAHELGVIHRDLKPSNVFLAGGSEVAPTIKVLDFGIAGGAMADAHGPKLTNMGSPVGTPAYMAPEQMMSASDVDPRSDIWSMGAMLYELITGELPFVGASELQFFANVMTKPPLPLRAHVKEQIPRHVEALLFNCLRRRREDRYSSMAELSDALRSTESALPG